MKEEYNQTPIGKIPKDRENINENIKFLLKILEDVRKETEKNQKEKVYVWSEHYSNWIGIWKYFDRCMGKEKFINSCLGFRLAQLNKELLWLWLECISGVYDNAARNLRYILESFLQAYYVDKEYPNASMECKLEILKEINRLVGKRLIENLDIAGKDKEQIKTLYSNLSKFIHPSYNEWQEIIEEGKINPKITFEYNKELFEKCVDFTDKMIDIIVFLLMNFCNEMVNEIKNDKIFLKSISNVKNSLVVQYIENFGGENDEK